MSTPAPPPAVRQQTMPDLLPPLMLMLTLVALLASAQSAASAPASPGTVIPFFRLFLSQVLYWWYYIALALVVRRHSARIALTGPTAARWTVLHAGTLVTSFFVHEVLRLAADKAILGIEPNAALFYTIFNNPAVWIEIFVYCVFLLAFSLLEYRRILLENEVRCTELEIQLVRSRLQELRSRMQPMFLFRTIQAILDLIRIRRNRDANEMLSLLSEFLRTVVYDTERDEITLEEEMRLLNQFLSIEKIRNSRTFRVREDIAAPALHAVVPNFILQPVVEELVYRIADSGCVQCTIHIGAEVLEGQIVLRIRENHTGSQPEDGEARDELALDVTRARLQQLYGEEQHVTAEFHADGGVSVIIRFPYRESAAVDYEASFIAENPV